MIKRSEYIEGDVTHEEYYGQFVTKQMVSIVKDRIGEKRLLASTDENLNDIPLKEWDDLPIDWDYKLLADTGETYPSQKTAAGVLRYGPIAASKVCIAKAAARRIIQEAKERP